VSRKACDVSLLLLVTAHDLHGPQLGKPALPQGAYPHEPGRRAGECQPSPSAINC